MMMTEEEGEALAGETWAGERMSLSAELSHSCGGSGLGCAMCLGALRRRLSERLNFGSWTVLCTSERMV